MKKIFKVVLTSLVALGAWSCSMDLREPGSIDTENALSSMNDAQKLRSGRYIDFRSRVGGDWVQNSEIQSDLFHPTTNYGNNWGSFFRWEFTANEGAVTNVWNYDYSAIANVNFFIEKIQTMMQNPSEEFSEEDLQTLELYLGECYFFRAYYHYDLAMRFCAQYDEGTAASELGIPYMEVYVPTSDRNTYPSRGTLEETYSKINADLQLAEDMITIDGSGTYSMYLNADIVDAFRARVFLNMGRYSDVINYAQPLISKYTLVSTADEFQAMWAEDSGVECLMMMDASNQSNNGATSMDISYMSYNSNDRAYEPFFLPEQGIVDIINEYSGDYRASQFLTYGDVTCNGVTAPVYMFSKFPGNPALFPDGMELPQSNYLHKNKPFRIAEVYLNLAEAYAQSNNTADATSTLNTLRAHRIPGFNMSTSYPDVMSEIKDERVRELIGEGFRIYDLKRWGDPVARTSIQEGSDALMYSHSSINETFPAGNFRFVWPIPQAELDANPNFDGQQNPGY